MTTQEHLRTYVDDSIQQKVRLGNLITGYQKQVAKSQDRVTNQSAIIEGMTLNNLAPEKIQQAKDRQTQDENILVNSQSFLADVESVVSVLVPELIIHLEELSKMEIGSTGFVQHSIGTDKGSSLDKETMLVQLKPNGHAEIPIGTELNQWDDRSQLRIKKVMKVGV